VNPRLLLAIIAISTGAPFARWAEPAPALAIAAMRVAAAAALLAIASRRELRALRTLAARDRRLVGLAGALLAIHFAAWIGSLALTSTAASVSIVCTSPMFAALLGALVGDRVAGRELVGIGIGALGCAVLAGGDWQAGGPALAGDALAAVGAASAAGYLVVGRKLRAAMPLMPYLTAVNTVAALALLAAALATGVKLAALPGHSYLACACGGAVASFVGHSMLNAAVRTTPTHLVALAVLAEPFGSSLITWAAFGEQPPVHAAIGGVVVVVGIAIGFARRIPATSAPSDR
jgi:drug/metabolite transporter (DMT)-like permease